MFESLSGKLTGALRNLSGRGKISEKNVRDSMAEVRTALLEADVHVDVVTDFCEEVVQDALGEKVTTSLKPGEKMIAIVNQRLIDLMGPVESGVMLVDPGPTIIMMCGLGGGSGGGLDVWRSGFTRAFCIRSLLVDFVLDFVGTFTGLSISICSC